MIKYVEEQIIQQLVKLNYKHFLLDEKILWFSNLLFDKISKKENHH